MVQANNAIAALTSRRNFIRSGSAVIAALAIPALANAAPAFGLDAELIELGRQLEGVSDKWWAASEPITRLGKVAENQYPPLPDVLKARETDKLFNLPKPNDGRWYRPIKGGNREEPGYYTQNHLNELKQFTPRQRREIPLKQYHRDKFGPEISIAVLDMEDDVFVSMVPWPEAQARVDELIAAIEGWRKACRRIDHATGYMKAQRDFQHLANKVFALDDKISEIEAKSLQGLRVKARTLQLIYKDDEDMGFGETTDQVLALSIIKGLLALPDQQS